MHILSILFFPGILHQWVEAGPWATATDFGSWWANSRPRNIFWNNMFLTLNIVKQYVRKQ